MARTHEDRVQLSITLDEALARRLQAQAARRSIPLADYVEEIVRKFAPEPNSPVVREAEGETQPAESLPSSVGMADVGFDARDTDSWLAAHWGRE